MDVLRRSLASLGLAILVGCGGRTTTSPSADAVSGTSDLEVHEWGLVRAGPADRLEVATFAERVEHAVPLVVEKPVLYFHLGAASTETVRVRVRATDGSIREHWPRTASVGDREVDYGVLRIERGTCRFTAPTRRAEACPGIPATEVCESLALAQAVTADADCVASDRFRAPMLFYRSTSGNLTVPLVARIDSNRRLVVENRGTDRVPGTIVWMHGATTRHVTITVVEPPRPGESRGVAFASQTRDVGRDSIRATFVELGLRRSEADAFLASWDRELFAEDLAEESPEERAAPEIPFDALLYFLPPALVERVSEIAIEPAPRAVRRAMAVYTRIAE